VTTPKPPNPQAWLPYAGFALAIAGVIYQGGIQSNMISQNTARIVALELAQKQSADAINNMNLRGERSAAKLDFLVEQAQRAEQRK